MMPSITQSQIFTLVRAYLLSLEPCRGFEVIKAQENRVAMPKAPLFVQLTPRRRAALSTTVERFFMPDEIGEFVIGTTPIDNNAQGGIEFLGPTQINIQADVFGETSSDFASVVATVFRTDYTVNWFASRNPALVPLYATEGQQMPLTTGEQQYKSRWTQELALQANLRMTANQDYMTAVEVDVINVEATYPAGD